VTTAGMECMTAAPAPMTQSSPTSTPGVYAPSSTSVVIIAASTIVPTPRPTRLPMSLASGLVKIGDTQYTVRTNAMPVTSADLNDIPIKYVNGQTVFLKDVSVLKNGNASTVAVVNGVRKVLAVARKAAPPSLSINELFDQSKLVTASIAGVLREGAIAAGLTGL